jgi:hypothetical protein
VVINQYWSAKPRRHAPRVLCVDALDSFPLVARERGQRQPDVAVPSTAASARSHPERACNLLRCRAFEAHFSPVHRVVDLQLLVLN